MRKTALQVAIFLGFVFIFAYLPLFITILALLLIADIWLFGRQRGQRNKKTMASMLFINFFLISQFAIAQMQSGMISGGLDEAGVFAARGGAGSGEKNYYSNWIRLNYTAQIVVQSNGIDCTYNVLGFVQEASDRKYSRLNQVNYPTEDVFPSTQLATLTASSGPTNLTIRITAQLSENPSRFNCPIPAGAYVQLYVNPITTYYIPGALDASVKPTLAPLNGGKATVYQTRVHAGQTLNINIETIAMGFDPAIDNRGQGLLSFDFDQVEVKTQVYVNGTLKATTTQGGSEYHPEFNFWGWLIPEQLMTIVIVFFFVLLIGMLITFLTRKVSWIKIMTWLMVIFAVLGFFWWLIDAPNRLPDWLGWITGVPILSDIVNILAYIFAGVQWILVIGLAVVVIYVVSRILTDTLIGFLGEMALR